MPNRVKDIIMEEYNLGLPWNYISRNEVIAGSGLQYGVQDWGLRDRYNNFIGKFMPEEIARHIIKLSEMDEGIA